MWNLPIPIPIPIPLPIPRILFRSFSSVGQNMGLMSPGFRAPQGAPKPRKKFCANGRVVQGGGLKPHYLRMRRFEPCFAHTNKQLIKFIPAFYYCIYI